MKGFHFMNVETNRRHQISSRTGSPCDLHTRVHLLLSRSHSVGSYFFGMLCTMINDMMSGKFRALSLALSLSLCLSFTASLAVDLFDILQGNALEMISNNGSDRDRSGRETERERGR